MIFSLVNWRLDPRQTGLLVIDAQERLLPAMAAAEPLLKNLVAALAVARQFGLPIFHTEQAPEKLGPTVARVREALGNGTASPRRKLDFSAAGCFGPDELPPTLLVAGVKTHVCVRQTVFDLRACGHAVYLLADAVGARAETDHRLALHELREHAGARVTTVETVAWELLGRAEGDAFKKLLTLLK